MNYKISQKVPEFSSDSPGWFNIMGLTHMAEGDTEVVLQAYTDRMKELAEVISGLDGVADEGKCYEELHATVQSLITDQGPTMPKFANKLRVLRKIFYTRL